MNLFLSAAGKKC